MTRLNIHDPVYGDVSFSGALQNLILTPAVQRLRHVRLSNVDSMSLPGFGGLTRYEHALGAAVVAAHLGFFGNLMERERVVLQAAALIHDTAITPYGHLVEEAFAYVGKPFDHEKKWQQLLDEQGSEEPGGVQSQIYMGREAGLRSWAERTFGLGGWREPLRKVIAAVKGEGEYGTAIAGGLDVDNIDNVARAALHMGIAYDRDLPTRLARAIRGVGHGRLIVDERGVGLVSEWLELRKAVYGKLMLAKMDYSGKAMLLACATAACEEGVIGEDDWRLTDWEFTSRVLASECERAAKPLRQWLLGDLWPLSDIVWMEGRIPTLAEMYRFSADISQEVGRCIAYRIKDKRHREVELRLPNGSDIAVGEKSDVWLFAVAADRERISAGAKRTILDAARDAFASEVVGHGGGGAEMEGTLFGG